MAKSKTSNPIIFRRHANIGAADAESDVDFLENCFVDTGDLDVLVDCESTKSIILGRTGAGKTALIKRISDTQENVIEISPEALSLSYLSNSNIIKFFEEAGVRLDVFYALLWRHVIIVELLRKKYHINDASRKKDFLELLQNVLMRDTAKKLALEYLDEWGDQFWEETEYRVKEFTAKLESDLKGNLSVGSDYLSLGAEGAKKLSNEQRSEIVQRANDTVSRVQIKKLRDLVSLLSEDVFDDPQQHYYVVIDRLDEDWVDDEIRLKIIRSLIETIRTLRKIRNVKIVVALRVDLFHRVLKRAMVAGFQEEKYEPLYLELRWNKEQLRQVIDKRINFLFKKQYTSSSVGIDDILPKKQIDKRTYLDYIIERSFYRPREAISFVNECIKEAEGRARITVQDLRKAEIAYSQRRLRSLADEWRAVYPSLTDCTGLLKRRTSPFTIEDFTEEEINNVIVYVLSDNTREKDYLVRLAERMFESEITWKEFLRSTLEIFYKVGLVGLKLDPFIQRQWAHLGDPEVTGADIKDDTSIDIHTTFWTALGVLRRKS